MPVASQSRGLVLWVPPREDEWNVFLPPFEQFMHVLIARYAQPVRHGNGVYRYRFPVEHAVAHGLWLVMVKLAEKYDWELESPNQTLNDVAPRVDRLLSAGLVYAYAGPDMAADAFFHAVIEPAESALARAQRVEPLENAFDVLAGQFFLGLMKRVLERVKELTTALEKYGRIVNDPVHRVESLTRQEPYCVFLTESGETHLIMDRIASLAKPDAMERDPLTEAVRIYGISSTLRRGLQTIRHDLQFAHACRHLPYRYRLMPEDVIFDHSRAETSWINTQLLLAAGCFPDQEHIEEHQYLLALERVRTSNPSDVVERFRVRMERRDPSYALWHRFLKGSLLARCKTIQAWSSVVTPDTMLSVYLRPVQANISIKGEEAIHLAALPGGDERAMGLDPETIARNIPWDRLSAEDAGAMLMERMLSPKVLANGIAQMRKKERLDVMHAALETDDRSEYLAAFIRLGVLKVNAALVQECERSMERDHLFIWLRDAVKRDATMDVSSSGKRELEMYARLAIRSLAKQTGKTLAALLGNPRMRMAWTSCFRTYFAPLIGAEQEDEYLPLRRLMPPRLWQNYVLSSELIAREEAYAAAAHGTARKNIAEYRAWEETAAEEEPVINLPRLLGLRSREVKELLSSRSTDEAVFRWLHAAEKDVLLRLLRTYRKNRKTYFKRMGKKRGG